MSRVINTDSAGKERNQLMRAVVLALRELMCQTDLNENTIDLAAFIALALEQVYQTIDLSVAAWEKRGYWVKADRFRMDWDWTDKLGGTMRKAVLAEDWATVAQVSAQLAGRLNEFKVPQRHRLGTPWEGARERLNTGR